MKTKEETLKHILNQIDDKLPQYHPAADNPENDRFYEVGLYLTKSEMLFLKEVLSRSFVNDSNR